MARWPPTGAYAGRDVTHLLRQGSANPVRYLPLSALAEATASAPAQVAAPLPAPAGQVPGEATEPGLRERILPLLEASENDLLWAQSRAGQELFHSNMLGRILRMLCAELLLERRGAPVWLHLAGFSRAVPLPRLRNGCQAEGRGRSRELSEESAGMPVPNK